MGEREEERVHQRSSRKPILNEFLLGYTDTAFVPRFYAKVKFSRKSGSTLPAARRTGGRNETPETRTGGGNDTTT